MNLIERQSQVTRELYEINVDTMQQLASLTREGIARYVSLNTDYLQKLGDRPGPAEWLELQQSYGASLLEGWRQDAEQGGRIMSSALERATSALRHAWSDAAETAVDSATSVLERTAEQAPRAARAAMAAAAAPVAKPAPAPKAAAPKAAPAAKPAPAAKAASPRQAADMSPRPELEDLNGVGPALARQLRAAGIDSVDKVAALDARELEDEKHPLHTLKGRMEADKWVEQARRLTRRGR